MITRGIRLTGLRREILSSLAPGREEATDELRKRVGLGRGVEPASPRWGSFSVSFARALRLLEEAGAVSLTREVAQFNKPCLRSVLLTDEGARVRGRLLAKDELGLALAPIEPTLEEGFSQLLARASEAELERISWLLGCERARRGLR